MHKIVNNTVQVPLEILQDQQYQKIEVERKGRKFAYLNLEQYEDFLTILQNTKFRKGDRVFWFKNGGSKIPTKINEETVNTNRIDVVTKVNLSFDVYSTILGDDVRYSTEEINGNKKGLAYENYLIKVEEYNKLNGTKY